MDERQSRPPRERKRWSGEGSDFVAQGKAYSTHPSTSVPVWKYEAYQARLQGTWRKTQVQSRTVKRRNAAKEAEARIRQIVADDS